MYNDLLKYITIPSHPKFGNYNNKDSVCEVCVKCTVKFYHYIDNKIVNINLHDDIDFNKELIIIFYYEYYSKYCSKIYKGYSTENVYKHEKICDDLTLPICDTNKQCEQLILKNLFNIVFIKDELLTENLCKNVVRQYGCLLKYIPNEKRTIEICKLAIEQDQFALLYVEEQTDELCKLAVLKNGYALKCVKEQTEEICILAMKQNKDAIMYVKNQTEEICKISVQQNGLSLMYIKNQTDEICKLAVRQNGLSICHVNCQTEEICKLAVQQNGWALKYVEHQTEEICKLAIRQNENSLYYVKYPNY